MADLSKDLFDDYGRPIVQIYGALPLSGGTLTGPVTFQAVDTGVGAVEVGATKSAADPYFRIGRDDTGVALNAVTDMLVIQAGGGGGNAAAGMGAGIAFNLSNDAHEVEKRASISCSLVTATNGAEDSTVYLRAMKAGALALVASFNGSNLLSSFTGDVATTGYFTTTLNYDTGVVGDKINIGGFDISPGHRALAIGSEEVVVAVGVKTCTEVYPVRINGATKYIALYA